MRSFGDSVAATPGYLAPERNADLGQIFKGAPWDILFKCGDANFVAMPMDKDGGTPNHIIARYAGLFSLWAAAQAAVIITDAAIAALSAGEKTLSADEGSALREATRYLDLARELVRDPNASIPPDLTPPDHNTTLIDLVRKNNLFYGAVGWVLLHEIGHLHLGHQSGATTALSLQQENEADAFATQWIFREKTTIPVFHYEFRIFAVATAMLWMGVMDQVRRGSSTHPHSSERLGRVRNLMDPAPDSPGLELAAYLLKASFVPQLAIPEVDHASLAFDEVLFEVSRQPR